MQPISTAAPASAPSPEATHQVVDSVLHAVLSIGRLMRQRSAGDQHEPATFWLMKNLAEDSMRVTDLASSTHLDTSTVSRHVSQLERAGLVERAPDPQDGRAQRVGLSAEGRSQLQAALDRRREALIRSFDGWDAADVHDLDRLLGRFVHSIENLTSDLEHA